MDRTHTIHSGNYSLKLFQWNIRSYSKNKPSLYNYLDSSHIDIIILCETWLQPNYHPTSPGFTAIHNKRFDGKGGVSVLVKTGLPFTYFIPNIDLPFNVQFIILEIQGISIAAGYVPPNVTMSTSHWSRIVSLLSTPFILMGDFNCHHMAWGNSFNDLKGVNLLEVINEHSLVVLNDGSSTRLSPSNSNVSVIDLALSSPDLALNCSCHTHDDTLGSDHFPLLVSITS